MVSMAVEGPPPPNSSGGNKRAAVGGGPGMARGVGRGALPPPPVGGVRGGAPMGLGAAPGEFVLSLLHCHYI